MSVSNGSLPCCEAGFSAHTNGSAACDYVESVTWSSIGACWRCVHGCICKSGFSFEWHDFDCKERLCWASTFHPGALELCLNISGRATLQCEKESLEIGPMTTAMYVGQAGKVNAWRFPGERHQFLTVEFSHEFLGQHLKGHEAGLHPLAKAALVSPGKAGGLGPVGKLDPAMRPRIQELMDTRLVGAARNLWFNAQAVTIAAEHFFVNPASQSAAGSRKNQIARERVDRAVAILKRDLANPPTLSQLGAEVGCSPFYLSRTFSRELGMTIPQFIRQVRMKEAADLLKSGKFNVTEAAVQVGYSSLSHFSQAFCEVMGCCPGLYPLGLSRARLHPAMAASEKTKDPDHSRNLNA